MKADMLKRRKHASTRVWQFAVAVLLWAAASVCHAGIVELQVESGRFTAMVEQIIRAYPFCPQEFNVLGEDHIIHRIELDGPVLLRRAHLSEDVSVSSELSVTTEPPQLVVPLLVQVKTLENAYNPARNDIADLHLRGNAILGLSFDGASLAVNFVGLEPDPGFDIAAHVSTYFAGIQLPVSFGAFEELLAGGAGSRTNGGGVTLNDAGWLALRVEYSETDCDSVEPAADGFGSMAEYERHRDLARAACRAVDEDAWRDFFGGHFGPRDGADEWNLFIDQHLLRQTFETRLRTELEWISDIALARLYSGWTPLGDAGAQIPLAISGDYDSWHCTLTFTANPMVHIFLEGDQLVIEGDLSDIDYSRKDLFHCVSSFTSLFAGFLIPGLNEALYGILNGVVNNYDFDFGEMDVPGMHCETTDSTLRCQAPAELPPLTTGFGAEPLGVFTMTHLSGEAQGFVAGGLLDVFSSLPYATVGATTPFELDMDDCCSDIWFAGGLTLDGFGNLCEGTPSIVNDRLDAYSIEGISGGWRIRLDRWTEDFTGSPYPAYVHVRSSGGVATYVIDPRPLPDEAACGGCGVWGVGPCQPFEFMKYRWQNAGIFAFRTTFLTPKRRF